MASFGTTPRVFGGLSIDRSVFRRLLPDDRWFVYASGLLNAGDANTATMELVYEKDDGTLVAIGSVTTTGATETKRRMGPFDLYASPGVPVGEVQPVIRLRASKDAGVDGTAIAWTIQVRLLPSKQ